MQDAEAISRTHLARPPAIMGSLSTLVVIHLTGLIVFTSWAFGGQAPWVRSVITYWGTLGVVLFVAACWSRRTASDKPAQTALRWLWPLLLFNVMVVAGCLNPSFHDVVIAGEPSLVLGDPVAWLPNSARPGLAGRELWQFDVIVLSCFNLVLAVQRRSSLRLILLILTGNAVTLAIFGTFQKLVHADGLWFGLVASPNSRFFATFIYHNHWGAFTLLNTASCLGLLWHFYRNGVQRDFWHSPVLLGALATLLLAATIPLSASRSSTVLMTGLLTGAFIHLLRRLIRHRRQHHAPVILPVAGIILSALLSVGAIAYLGREVIAQRAQLTAEQIATAVKEDTLNSRLALYRDTWRMAAEKPWFGWGLESYPYVFRIFNTQRAVEARFWIPFYRSAHNDWLQSLAETGFIGTGLRGLLVLLPLLAVPWRRVRANLPRYLLAGGAIILLYAWVEFPFANPAVLLTFCATFYCAVRYAALDLKANPAPPAR